MAQKWYDIEPWPTRTKDGHRAMSAEHKKEFHEQAWQEHLKQEYEMALEFHSVPGAPWEELSQDQKDSVEISVKQHAQEMQAFGKAIASGDSNEIDRTGKKLAGLK